MKRLLIIMLAMMMVFAAYAAPTTLKFNTWIAKNDSARLESVKATIGVPDENDPAEGTYKIIHADKNRTLYSSWMHPEWRRLDTFEDVEEVLMLNKIPYNGNVGKVRVSKIIDDKERVLISYDLRKLCDRDGNCTRPENHLSCPSDCKITEADLVCEAKMDTFCDPDCADGLDKDCKKPEPSKGMWVLSAAIAAMAIFIIALILIYIKTHKRKSRRYR